MGHYWQGFLLGAAIFGGAGGVFGWFAWNRKAKLQAAIGQISADALAEVRGAAARLGVRL